MRKLGWVMVGSGLLVAVGGHCVLYGMTGQGSASMTAVGWSLGGLCFALIGLLLVQLRS